MRFPLPDGIFSRIFDISSSCDSCSNQSIICDDMIHSLHTTYIQDGADQHCAHNSLANKHLPTTCPIGYQKIFLQGCPTRVGVISD